MGCESSILSSTEESRFEKKFVAERPFVAQIPMTICRCASREREDVQLAGPAARGHMEVLFSSSVDTNVPKFVPRSVCTGLCSIVEQLVHVQQLVHNDDIRCLV